MKRIDIKITVSLSTTPKRVEFILPTLRSLLQQTKAPDEILLCIPRYCERLDQHLEELPEYLLKLEKTTQLKLLITEDYGPATKFIPAWKNIAPSESHFLIWLDDDIEYASNLVEQLVKNCPVKAAISASGFTLTPHEHKMGLRHLMQVDILEGWSGVCCRTSDIPDLDQYWTLKPYKDLSYIEKCNWHSDDYVMSRALQDNGIKTVVCYTPFLNRFKNTPLEYGLKDDALQNSSTTKGHHAAYAALERRRNLNKLLTELKLKHKSMCE